MVWWSRSTSASHCIDLNTIRNEVARLAPYFVLKNYLRTLRLFHRSTKIYYTRFLSVLPGKCKSVQLHRFVLVYHRGLTPQQAVDHCCHLIRSSYIAFQEPEPRLLQIWAEHDIVNKVQAFLRCCKNERIGLVNWL